MNERAKRCKQCKKNHMLAVRANPKQFTEEEAEIIRVKIRTGVRTIGIHRSLMSHTNCDTTEADCVQAAYCSFLQCDLPESFDACCALACGCGKTMARRVYNRCSMRFKDAILNDDGEYVSPLDSVPSHEPDYEFEPTETEMDRDNLHEALAELRPDERKLLLCDEGSVSVQDKPARAILMTRLKSTIDHPSIQIQPL